LETAFLIWWPEAALGCLDSGHSLVCCMSPLYPHPATWRRAGRILDLLSFLPHPVPNQHPLWEDTLLLLIQQNLLVAIHSAAAVQNKGFTTSSQTEDAVMKGLSPAHSPCFCTAIFSSRRQCIVLCEEDEALNRTTKKTYPNQKLKASVFLMWG